MPPRGRSTQDDATRREMAQDSAARADELDLAIVNCLQLQPRASWTLVGGRSTSTR